MKWLEIGKTPNYKENVEVLDVETCDSWKLILVTCSFSYHNNLFQNVKDKLYKLVYSKSDGYGIEGYIPPQGYDWSGIRDSSENAHQNMTDIARRFLLDNGISKIEYERQIY